jgi:hypothetical protein
MKKAFGLVLILGVLVAGMATAALAAVPGDGVRDLAGTESQAGLGYARGFVDSDGADVNDNFIDADRDGICDNFVDTDGDGINDLRGTRGVGGHGPHGTGDCDGDNFIDIDGDGVCDNVGSGVGHQGMGPHGQRGTP